MSFNNSISVSYLYLPYVYSSLFIGLTAFAYTIRPRKLKDMVLVTLLEEKGSS